MPVEVVRLADFSLSLKAQPIDMPHGGGGYDYAKSP